MTEVNANRAAVRPTSTEIMEDASELSHSVKEGEGRALEWQADHKTMMTGLREEHEVDPSALVSDSVGYVAKAVGFGGLAAGGQTVAKGVINNLAELRADPLRVITEKVARPALSFAQRAITTEPATKLAAGLEGTSVIVAGGAMAVAEVVHAFNKGDELKKLSDLDAIDVGTTALLKLDDGFRAADIAKHPAIMPDKLVSFMMTSEYGKAHLPALQAEADEGARAALVALRCGGREAYFKLHPEDSERLAKNVAFNKGFESVMWCASQQDGDARLDAVRKGLNERDARSSITTAIKG